VRILTKLLVRSFAGPFLAVFFVVLFVLVLQFLWKYADDLIGKGLEWYVIGELLFYASASLVPLALPLAILLASIMTFGNFGEFNELTAVKTAGVSLQRFMVPLMFVVAGVCVGAFYFSNSILPMANLKFQTLLYDVRESKPALQLKEGTFYNGIQGFSIRIGKKGADNQTLQDVLIYDHSAGLGNTIVVTAKRGKMAMSDDEHYLILKLFNGARYEEMPSDPPGSFPQLRYSFAEQQFNFDLSAFQLKRSDESTYKDHYAMLSIRQLTTSMDSIKRQESKREDEIGGFLYNYFAFRREPSYLNYVGKRVSEKALDSLLHLALSEQPIRDNALNNVRSLKGYANMLHNEVDYLNDNLARHEIEWHRKFTLSAACLVLFFIGAPLGAIIRKGGLGMPMVVAIGLFLVYHILSISSEKLARERVVNPGTAMWFSAMILFPLGAFLTYKATNDSALMDISVYRGFANRLAFWRKTPKAREVAIEK